MAARRRMQDASVQLTVLIFELLSPTNPITSARGCVLIVNPGGWSSGQMSCPQSSRWLAVRQLCFSQRSQPTYPQWPIHLHPTYYFSGWGVGGKVIWKQHRVIESSLPSCSDSLLAAGLYCQRPRNLPDQHLRLETKCSNMYIFEISVLSKPQHFM